MSPIASSIGTWSERHFHHMDAQGFSTWPSREKTTVFLIFYGEFMGSCGEFMGIYGESMGIYGEFMESLSFFLGIVTKKMDN